MKKHLHSLNPVVDTNEPLEVQVKSAIDASAILSKLPSAYFDRIFTGIGVSRLTALRRKHRYAGTETGSTASEHF